MLPGSLCGEEFERGISGPQPWSRKYETFWFSSALNCLWEIISRTGIGPLNHQVLTLSRPRTNWSGSKQVLSGHPQLTAVTRGCKSLHPSRRVIPICTSSKSTRPTLFTQPRISVVPAVRRMPVFNVTVKVINFKIRGKKDFLRCLIGVPLNNPLSFDQMNNLWRSFYLHSQSHFTLPYRRDEVLHEIHFCSAEWRDTTWEATTSLKTPEAAIILFPLYRSWHTWT